MRKGIIFLMTWKTFWDRFVIFVRSIICVQNIVQKSCPFPDSKPDAENNDAMADGIKNAYTKGRMDILCSLASYKIISLKTAAYMAGMNQKMFENEIWHWQHDWEYMESEDD